MFVSYDTRNERSLYSSDENLFHDHLWSFNGIMQDSCSMICVRFSKTRIFHKIFSTSYKIMHGHATIVYDQCV